MSIKIVDSCCWLLKKSRFCLHFLRPISFKSNTYVDKNLLKKIIFIFISKNKIKKSAKQVLYTRIQYRSNIQDFARASNIQYTSIVLFYSTILVRVQYMYNVFSIWIRNYFNSINSNLPLVRPIHHISGYIM